jgi:hypothetical protein
MWQSRSSHFTSRSMQAVRTSLGRALLSVVGWQSLRRVATAAAAAPLVIEEGLSLAKNVLRVEGLDRFGLSGPIEAGLRW